MLKQWQRKFINDCNVDIDSDEYAEWTVNSLSGNNIKQSYIIDKCIEYLIYNYKVSHEV